MDLAISNIAWPPEIANEAYAILKTFDVTGLEIAPGLLFANEPDAFEPTHQAIHAVLSQLMGRNLNLVSMQSLLFGVNDAELFGTSRSQDNFCNGLRRAIGLASKIGIGNLVVGSPKNRIIPEDMRHDDAWAVAIDHFRKVGDYAQKNSCTLAIEPNPSQYGTNFLTNVSETVKFVQRVGHEAVKLNFDVGAILMNEETDQMRGLFGISREITSHVHISSPNLGPVPDSNLNLSVLFSVLADENWDRWISIEMLPTKNDILENIERAIAECSRCLSSTKSTPVLRR